MTIKSKRPSFEEDDTINEALTTDDRELFISFLNRPDMVITYEKQVALLDWISDYQPDLAMMVFDGGTPIQLSLTTQAHSAFRSNYELMVDILMRQKKLQKKKTRAMVLQDAIDQGSPLIRKFAEEIIAMYIETQDQRLMSPLIPEMENIQDVFIF